VLIVYLILSFNLFVLFQAKWLS